MSITIIQKSDLSVRKRDPKVALVLAGGAVTGGAFKLGGLKALDDFLINRKTVDFDLYVGLSAGSLLSAALAAGVTPPQSLRAMDGTSDTLSRFRPSHFYNPNFSEFVTRPVDYLLDSATFLPRTIGELVAESPALWNRVEEPLREFRETPSWDRLVDVAEPIAKTLLRKRLPMPHQYIPSGLCDNSTIEAYLRDNLEANGVPNDFKSFYRQTGRELYICAMNLDTAEQVVFGHDEDSSATISEAVQASTALPGFYRPARIRGVDYVDGGVRRTANIDVAIEHGADLIICYNPFRPFSNRVLKRYDSATGRFLTDGEPLAKGGLLAILNQVFRTLLHTRLQYGLKAYQEDDSFRGDIIVIEPAETDTGMFTMNPLALWDGPRAGRYGYTSVTHSIDTYYDTIKQILQSYGILMTRREVREGLERMNQGSFGDSEAVLMRDVPRRELDVA